MNFTPGKTMIRPIKITSSLTIAFNTFTNMSSIYSSLFICLYLRCILTNENTSFYVILIDRFIAPMITELLRYQILHFNIIKLVIRPKEPASRSIVSINTLCYICSVNTSAQSSL
ncbi:hypothetical protein FR483_n617R [Paramecium bursaria Chlorella virus FR483]|uniref:Uncharacterized protein n617R n=1 Tax=Paramecium bursaria Chlorella virus FR483 TaxID=399781 RepID=A7J7X1_PBCVF|nr:hypothetical protein FR483_n617R [Paramecium bursaria Chlorella virus FR483]ABT15902.1 hypothetical protein FR483_n617R [Paramecium bursaria Chlorella virus FR483]